MLAWSVCSCVSSWLCWVSGGGGQSARGDGPAGGASTRTFLCELLAQLIGILHGLVGGGLEGADAGLSSADGRLILDVGAELLRLQLIEFACLCFDLGEQRLHELDGGLGEQRLDAGFGDGVGRGDVAGVDCSRSHGGRVW